MFKTIKNTQIDFMDEKKRIVERKNGKTFEKNDNRSLNIVTDIQKEKTKWMHGIKTRNRICLELEDQRRRR